MLSAPTKRDKMFKGHKRRQREKTLELKQERLLKILRRHNVDIDGITRDCRKERG